MFYRKIVFDENSDKHITIFQLFGLILLILGVLAIVTFAFIDNCSAGVAISFVIIMLGYSLAFPSLLQDQNQGLSTMRIVVFMMANVICLLMIKYGWNLTNFHEIKIDEYWMGIIAFIFGAKATQAYFESKMAERNNDKDAVG